MTYSVFGGTLNLTPPLLKFSYLFKVHWCYQLWQKE